MLSKVFGKQVTPSSLESFATISHCLQSLHIIPDWLWCWDLASAGSGPNLPQPLFSCMFGAAVFLQTEGDWSDSDINFCTVIQFLYIFAFYFLNKSFNKHYSELTTYLCFSVYMPSLFMCMLTCIFTCINSSFCGFFVLIPFLFFT